MSGSRVIACETCKGHGVIQKEVKPGKWEEQKCSAKCRNGKITINTL